jgi:hypothetical protein
MISIIAASPSVRLPEIPSADQKAVETADLLRQLLDVQREQLHLSRALAANNCSVSRSRRFLEKWAGEFPEIGPRCKEVLPNIERFYLRLLDELTEKLTMDDLDDYESEYVLGEFLDKYGTRLNQLNTLINNLSPISDAVPPPPPPDTEGTANTQDKG